VRRGRLLRALPANAADASGATTSGAAPRTPDDAAQMARRLTEASTQGQRLEQHADRIVELSRLLAERLVGDALDASDAALAQYALALIDEARGARAVVLHARPEDALRLERALRAHDFDGRDVRVAPEPSLASGQLRLECELGCIEASVEASLERLAEHARTVLAESELTAQTPSARLRLR
jgi:flagellar biosynthesis/type III secretory pathway protein FliH